MSAAAELQTQISGIMEVLLRAAVAEIGELLEEEHRRRSEELRSRNQEIRSQSEELRRRSEEIRGLRRRLLLTEGRLRRLAEKRASCGGQSESRRPAVTPQRAPGPVVSLAPVRDCLFPPSASQQALEEVPWAALKQEPPQHEELSGLELEMKIEQLEQKLAPDQSYGPPEPLLEPYGAPVGCSSSSVLAEDHRNAVEFSLSLFHHSEPHSGTGSQQPALARSSPTASQQPAPGRSIPCSHTASHQPALGRSTLYSHTALHQPAPSRSTPRSHTASHQPAAGRITPRPHTASLAPSRGWGFPGLKAFRCEECGKGFTQRMRLITHRRIHTGEKPFLCQLCGKSFARQDNCVRHVRLHSRKRP